LVQTANKVVGPGLGKTFRNLCSLKKKNKGCGGHEKREAGTAGGSQKKQHHGLPEKKKITTTQLDTQVANTKKEAFQGEKQSKNRNGRLWGV